MSTDDQTNSREERVSYPHRATGSALEPVQEFRINGRWASLYAVAGRPPGNPYSLYWNDAENPIQHGMTPLEVFNLLSQLLAEGESRALVVVEEGITFACAPPGVNLVVVNRNELPGAEPPASHADLGDKAKPLPTGGGAAQHTT